MRAVTIMRLTFLLFPFHAVAQTTEDSDLSMIFCHGDQFYFGETELSVVKKTDYYIISCDCNCTGDNTSVILFEWPKRSHPKILLQSSNLRSYVIQSPRAVTNAKSTKGLFDIELYVRKNPDNPHTNIISDIVKYNGIGYEKSTYNTDRIVVSGGQDEKLAKEIENHLKQEYADKPKYRPLPIYPILEDHKSALALFKSGKKYEAARLLLKSAGPKPWSITGNLVVVYNDLGFFLEQAKQYKDAIEVLNAVIEAFPDRTVAYLNLGDVYLGNGDIAEAKSAYIKYSTLMAKAGQKQKIPDRVIKLISN